MTGSRSEDRAAAIGSLTDWLLWRGVQGAPFGTILAGYCGRLVAAGIPLMRVHATLSAYHPEFGSEAHRWTKGIGPERERFVRANAPPQGWLESPLYQLLSQDAPELRERLDPDGPPSRYPFLNDLREIGGTDYFSTKVAFSPISNAQHFDPLNPPEGLAISWASDAPGGFSEADLADLRFLLPYLSLTLKAWSRHQMAEDLLAAYLGRDAGERVMSGAIQRGTIETIGAVILCFDLRGFTGLTETYPGEDVIAMLNDYFDAVVHVIEDHGGNVLKFMGDGLLAIFSRDENPEAHLAALDAAAELRRRHEAITLSRREAGLPQTGFGLGLHAGDVAYGNIGAVHRLDFTVIGSAVNATARMLDMCDRVGQNIVISARVAQPALGYRSDLVSLGQFRLRGIAERQELFTLD